MSIGASRHRVDAAEQVAVASGGREAWSAGLEVAANQRTTSSSSAEGVADRGPQAPVPVGTAASRESADAASVPSP